MNYLFFDIECSNCFNGVGKICEFGYTLFDNNFNLKEKRNIFINPDSVFRLKGHNGEEGITLSKPNRFYYKQPIFPYLYDKIKSILTDKNNYVFAYSSHSDIGFLAGTIKRYGLRPFDFTCYDAQKIAAKYTNEFGNCPGLEKMFNLLCEKDDSLTAHEASDDSYMTGLVVKAILEKENQPFKKYIKDIDGLTDSSLEYYEFLQAKENLAVLIASLRVSLPILNSEKSKNRRYAISKKVKQNKELYIKTLTKLKKKNLILSGRMKSVDYVLYHDDVDKQALKLLKKKIGATYKLVNIDKFLAK